MEPIYWEQYRRIKRIYRHLKSSNDGRIHIQDSANYQDEMYAYFTACYHLKDWIINDPNKRIPKNVETFINENKPLQIAGDICNGFKHFNLKAPRFGSGARVANSVIGVSLGAPYPEINIKFLISADDGNYDAFDVASKCLDIWTDFLIENDPDFKSNFDAGKL